MQAQAAAPGLSSTTGDHRMPRSPASPADSRLRPSASPFVMGSQPTRSGSATTSTNSNKSLRILSPTPFSTMDQPELHSIQRQMPFLPRQPSPPKQQYATPGPLSAPAGVFGTPPSPFQAALSPGARPYGTSAFPFTAFAMPAFPVGPFPVPLTPSQGPANAGRRSRTAAPVRPIETKGHNSAPSIQLEPAAFAAMLGKSSGAGQGKSKRAVVVRLPDEGPRADVTQSTSATPSDAPAKAEGGAIFPWARRIPAAAATDNRLSDLIPADVVVTRATFPVEWDVAQQGLPETIEIYLPGRLAWQRYVQDRKAELDAQAKEAAERSQSAGDEARDEMAGTTVRAHQQLNPADAVDHPKIDAGMPSPAERGGLAPVDFNQVSERNAKDRHDGEKADLLDRIGEFPSRLRDAAVAQFNKHTHHAFTMSLSFPSSGPSFGPSVLHALGLKPAVSESGLSDQEAKEGSSLRQTKSDTHGSPSQRTEQAIGGAIWPARQADGADAHQLICDEVRSNVSRDADASETGDESSVLSGRDRHQGSEESEVELLRRSPSYHEPSFEDLAGAHGSAAEGSVLGRWRRPGAVRPRRLTTVTLPSSSLDGAGSDSAGARRLRNYNVGAVADAADSPSESIIVDIAAQPSLPSESPNATLGEQLPGPSMSVDPAPGAPPAASSNKRLRATAQSFTPRTGNFTFQVPQGGPRAILFAGIERDSAARAGQAAAEKRPRREPHRKGSGDNLLMHLDEPPAASGKASEKRAPSAERHVAKSPAELTGFFTAPCNRAIFDEASTSADGDGKDAKSAHWSQGRVQSRNTRSEDEKDRMVQSWAQDQSRSSKGPPRHNGAPAASDSSVEEEIKDIIEELMDRVDQSLAVWAERLTSEQRKQRALYQEEQGPLINAVAEHTSAAVKQHLETTLARTGDHMLGKHLLQRLEQVQAAVERVSVDRGEAALEPMLERVCNDLISRLEVAISGFDSRLSTLTHQPAGSSETSVDSRKHGDAGATGASPAAATVELQRAVSELRAELHRSTDDRMSAVRASESTAATLEAFQRTLRDLRADLAQTQESARENETSLRRALREEEARAAAALAQSQDLSRRLQERDKQVASLQDLIVAHEQREAVQKEHILALEQKAALLDSATEQLAVADMRAVDAAARLAEHEKLAKQAQSWEIIAKRSHAEIDRANARCVWLEDELNASRDAAVHQAQLQAARDEAARAREETARVQGHLLGQEQALSEAVSTARADAQRAIDETQRANAVIAKLKAQLELSRATMASGRADDQTQPSAPASAEHHGAQQVLADSARVRRHVNAGSTSAQARSSPRSVVAVLHKVPTTLEKDGDGWWRG